MSLVHLTLERTHETSEVAEYIALSSDFNEERTWKPVAKIVIRKALPDYEFFPLNEWKGMDLMDPKMYGLPEHELEAKIRSGNHGYNGAWTGRIHEWVMRLIERQEYPEIYPK